MEDANGGNNSILIKHARSMIDVILHQTELLEGLVGTSSSSPAVASSATASQQQQQMHMQNPPMAPGYPAPPMFRGRMIPPLVDPSSPGGMMPPMMVSPPSMGIGGRIHQSMMPRPMGTSMMQIEIFLDPHTKVFLLIQAHLQKADLPITDYINDTKTVMDQVPRLLAAMQYAVAEELSQSAASFDLMCNFVRTNQFLATRSTFDDTPFMQLPNFPVGLVPAKHTLASLRKRPQAQTKDLLLKWGKGRYKNKMDTWLKTLYKLPLIVKVDSSVTKHPNKGKCRLNITMEISGECSNDESTLSILIGTVPQRMFLALDSIYLKSSMARNKTLTNVVKREVDFDWGRAQGTEGKNVVIVRYMMNNARGLDVQQVVNLV